MSVATMIERIKKEALPCAACGSCSLKLIPIDSVKLEMYWASCNACGHRRIEVDFDQAKENDGKRCPL